MRIPENVKKFAQGDSKLLDKWVDYFNHYRAINDGKNVEYVKVDKEGKPISFDEKTKQLHNDIELEIAKYAGTNNTMFSDSLWKMNPMYRFATFAVIGALVDAIIPDTIIDSYGLFADVRVGGFGDSFAFDVKSNDLMTITKSSNNRRNAFAQKQFTSQQTLIPENRIITVESDLYRILCGKENLAEFAMRAVKSLETELALDIYTAFNSTYSSLPANFKAGGFTQDDFIKIASRVKAANGGANTVVVGTPLALSRVLPTNDYLKMQISSDYVKVGYLKNFLGTDILSLEQKVDWSTGNYDFLLDDTKLYFLSTNTQRLVKIALEGETISIPSGQFDNANLMQTTTMQKRWACSLISNAKYGMMTV